MSEAREERQRSTGPFSLTKFPNSQVNYLFIVDLKLCFSIFNILFCAWGQLVYSLAYQYLFCQPWVEATMLSVP